MGWPAAEDGKKWKDVAQDAAPARGGGAMTGRDKPRHTRVARQWLGVQHACAPGAKLMWRHVRRWCFTG